MIKKCNIIIDLIEQTLKIEPIKYVILSHDEYLKKFNKQHLSNEFDKIVKNKFWIKFYDNILIENEITTKK